MTYVVLLSVLALCDFMLCGFRAAAGTDGRIEKRALYRSAVVRSAWLGALALLLHALLAGALVVSDYDPSAVWMAFTTAARVSVVVFGAFATTILMAFCFYFARGDVRVLANVIVLGPLTLLRPLVVAAGLSSGILAAHHPRVTVVGLVAMATSLGFQGLVDLSHRDTWRRLVRDRKPRAEPARL